MKKKSLVGWLCFDGVDYPVAVCYGYSSNTPKTIKIGFVTTKKEDAGREPVKVRVTVEKI